MIKPCPYSCHERKVHVNRNTKYSLTLISHLYPFPSSTFFASPKSAILHILRYPTNTFRHARSR